MIKGYEKLDSLVKESDMAENNKNNDNTEEIESGQGNGILLPQADRALAHLYLLKGFFFMEKLGDKNEQGKI